MQPDASFCHRAHAAGYDALAKKASFAKGLIFGGRLPWTCVTCSSGSTWPGSTVDGAERQPPLAATDCKGTARISITNHAEAVTKAQLQPSRMEAKALVAIKGRVARLDLLERAMFAVTSAVRSGNG